MAGYTITCPLCSHVGDEQAFDMSLADECFCPDCGAEFILDDTEDGDDEEESIGDAYEL